MILLHSTHSLAPLRVFTPYRFLGTLLKVHYVMAIRKLSMKFIQCD
jgi:hypothetical protein